MVNHIAFIMDGNRRYAKKQNLSPKEGYEKGLQKLIQFIALQVKYKIPITSFYGLSSDNYKKRSPEELEILFNLTKELYENEELNNFFKEHKIKVNLKGNVDEIIKKEKKNPIRNKIITNMQKEFEKRNNSIGKSEFTVNIAINYKGQEEITHAVKEIAKKIESKELSIKSITPKTIKKHLFFTEEPPEIIVRPGNAPRLSGFMLWDSEYSEIYLTKKLWPELSEVDLMQILNWFKEQNRNFGK